MFKRVVRIQCWLLGHKFTGVDLKCSRCGYTIFKNPIMNTSYMIGDIRRKFKDSENKDA